MTGPGNPCADVIASLSGAIDAVLGPLLPPAGVPVALLDYPNHANVGDSAIWLGEELFLRRRGPTSPTSATCTPTRRSGSPTGSARPV